MSSITSHLPNERSHATFGFLNVVELPSLGFCGGMLIVSSIGRPVEFHCTAPVTVNRSQQIMYGQTYRGFLYSEQIGAALINKIKNPPSILLTNSPDMLPISELVDWPVLLMEHKTEETPFDGSGLRHLDAGDHHCWCTNIDDGQLGLLRFHTDKFVGNLPFDEPMERIAQAIEEAHSVLRAA